MILRAMAIIIYVIIYIMLSTIFMKYKEDIIFKKCHATETWSMS